MWSPIHIFNARRHNQIQDWRQQIFITQIFLSHIISVLLAHGIFLSPASCSGLVLVSVCLVHVGDFWDQRIIRIWVRQQGADWEQHLKKAKRWLVAIPKHKRNRTSHWRWIKAGLHKIKFCFIDQYSGMKPVQNEMDLAYIRTVQKVM